MNDEIQFKVLNLVQENPEITQRQLAAKVGVSLGKANYCLKALLEKGWIKANNFKNSNNKMAYVYLLTPNGFEAKTKLTVSFLKRKVDEFETLKREIAELQLQVDGGAKKSD